jgi:hypothetical protein
MSALGACATPHTSSRAPSIILPATLALPPRTRARWAWAAALPALWALAWTVTTLAGIAVDEQFTIFGASGAFTFSALSGLLLHQLLPYRTVTSPHPAPRTPIKARA